MRKGYAIKQLSRIEAHFVCPAGGILAKLHMRSKGSCYIACQFTYMEPQTISESDLVKVLGAMAEKHYQMTTTRKQRRQDWRREFFGDPIWGWLAFIVTAVVAVAGWIY